MKFTDLKIGTKIMLGFGIVALITAAVGVIGYNGVNKVSQSFHEVAEVRMPSVEYLLEMETGLENYRVAQRTLLNPNLSKEDKARQFRNIAEARKRYGDAIQKFEPLDQTEQEAILWKQFRKELENWRLVNESFEKQLDEIEALDIFYPMQFLKDFQTFQGDHYKLQVDIANTIRSGQVFDGGDDHTACRLGQYLPTINTTNASVNQALNELKEPHRQFHKAVHDIKRLVNNGQQSQAWTLYQNVMLPSAEKVFGNFELVVSEAQRAVAMFENAELAAMSQSRQAQIEAMALLDQIITINKDVAEAAVNTGDEAVRNADAMVIGGIIVGLLLAIVLGFVITRMISTGIIRGVSFAEVIAKGDLTAEIEDEYLNRKDEIGQLGNALQNMVGKLREVVESILNGSESIASASQQMSSTSQEMSQSASEQASSVEEVSSSMEEMVSNIQQNADNSQQTEKIATNAVVGIREGSEATNTAVSSMKNIAEKIRIINDIAFQTNILALNAAVEAARAGEHGKGFAVVAAEVRKLAERSKVAADEIDDLSKNGVEVAEKAGTKLNEIVPEIEKTAKLVQEISAASMEQNNGAEQVNNAVQQVNNATQQNAAASEEIATSSEELSSQAESLKDIISYFVINRSRKLAQQSAIAPKSHLNEFSEGYNGKGAGKKQESESKKGANIYMSETATSDSEFEKM